MLCCPHHTFCFFPADSCLKVIYFFLKKKKNENTSSFSSALLSLQTWTNARRTPTTVTPPRSASTRPAATPAPATRATGSSPDSVRVGRTEPRSSSRNYLNTGVGPEKVNSTREKEGKGLKLPLQREFIYQRVTSSLRLLILRQTFVAKRRRIQQTRWLKKKKKMVEVDSIRPPCLFSIRRSYRSPSGKQKVEAAFMTAASIQHLINLL